MSLRFDDDEHRLRLSVADLLERDARGSLGFGNRGGFERMWLGQAIHSRYQSEALKSDPHYRQEVALSLDLVHRGWSVTLIGRADGLTRGEGDAIVVEEIKSVRRAGQLGRTTLELYEQQAAIYAWILKQQESTEVRAELVLIEIGTYDIERHAVPIDPRAVAVSVHRRLAALIRDHEDRREARLKRHDAASRMRFPYAQMRQGQSDIIHEVERALVEREHLFVEATTGLGKTVATLFPALRFAQLHDKKVFILTAKNLQQEMASEVLRMLNHERSFHSLRLRAKARMCANSELLCHEEYCRFARDYFLKLHSAQVTSRLLESYADLQPEAIFEHARESEVCPFEVSLELAGDAQAIVCDYNYVFDPYVALSHFTASSDLSDTILVIDEAHNLLDRGRGYYSPELGEMQLGLLQRSLHPATSELHADIEALSIELSELIQATVDDLLPPGGADAAAEGVLPEEEMWAMRPSFDRAFIDYVEHQRQSKTYQADDPVVTFYFDFVRFLNAFALADASFSFVVHRQRGLRSFKILCRDASPFLGHIINRTHSTIALSATLSPADFYQELLGFDHQRTSSLSLPSPFPADNRRIVIDAAVTTTWKQRQANYPLIAERLAAFINEVPGNTMALFPSYVFMEEVAARMPDLDCELVVQQRSDSAERREEILDRLRGSLFGHVALFAVAGGVFSEGVDYPGSMLEAVAIVGPCLPSLTFEQQLLRVYYDDRFEKGFEYAFVIPGMTRVVQAAGRLIRSAEDRGVIALLDRRFVSELYARHLPSTWLPEGGVKTLVGSAEGAARAFFEATGGTPEIPSSR